MHIKHILIRYKLSKQNHSARLIFFATTYGAHTESALPLLNLVDVLTVHNVYRFQFLKSTYLWHKGLLPTQFSIYFQYAGNVHNYNTRYALKKNLYEKKLRTNTRKQTIGYAACIVSDKIPLNVKEINVYQFSKQLKPYLLSEQHSYNHNLSTHFSFHCILPLRLLLRIFYIFSLLFILSMYVN